MRRSIQFILLLFFSSIHCLPAQKTMFAYVVNYQRLIQYNTSNELFGRKIAEDYNRSKIKTNAWGFGFVSQFRLYNNWSLNSGILFGRREFRNGEFGIKKGGNAFYLSAPIIVHYCANNRKIEPSVGLGFNNYFSLLSLNDGENVGVQFDRINPGMRKYTISALIQAGINIRIKENSRLRIQFDFEQHLSSLSKGSVKLTPRAPGITVGFVSRFNIFKYLFD